MTLKLGIWNDNYIGFTLKTIFKYVYTCSKMSEKYPFTDQSKYITRKRGNCECIATWRPHDVALVVLFCFGQICTAHAHKLLYIWASDQNSYIAIRFSDPDFLKESNNLAIRRRFHSATLTLNVCSTSRVTCSNSVLNVSEIEGQLRHSSWS